MTEKNEISELVRDVEIATGRKVAITHEWPPIPDRRFDWMASFEDYDLGDPIGHGPTPADAVLDLMVMIDLRDDSDRFFHETGAQP